MKRYWVLILVLALFGLAGCGASTESHELQRPAPEFYRQGKVVLGSPRLTAGIPGSGDLTIEEIKSWLAEPKNHQPLQFALPIGLTDAAELVYIPADNPLTRAKIELGRQLFFDQRLSGFGGISCAVCHQPKQHYSAFLVMPEIRRNASVVFNRLFSKEQFWDGKADSLEHQPIVPISSPFEMDSTPEKTTRKVRAILGYRLQHEAVFGEVTFENICKALASFQRALVTGPAPWDYCRLLREYENRLPETLSKEERAIYEQLRKGAAEHPMSKAALRGEELFFSERAACGNCHAGPNLTDEAYHNVGVGFDEPDPDLGRYRITHLDQDKGAFKTPTLRNVAGTPPYMHNGKFDTLEEVVEWFVQGGPQNEHLNLAISPLELSVREQQDLLAFLKSLTSPLPEVERARLPP